MPVFLMHCIKTHMFNHSTRVFKLVIVMGLPVCALTLTRAACIANTLQVLTAHYVFTRVRHMHYLSSSNSPVLIRIGNHTIKGRLLILLVMTNFLLLLTQFNLLTTADSAIPLYTCSRINPVTKNNRSGTLITM